MPIERVSDPVVSGFEEMRGSGRREPDEARELVLNEDPVVEVRDDRDADRSECLESG